MELDISSWEGTTYAIVGHALRHNSAFKTLKVCNVCSKAEFLRDLVPCLAGNTSLTSLHLDGSGLKPGMFKDLAEAISLNPESGIRHLDLSRNMLSYDDALDLCKAFSPSDHVLSNNLPFQRLRCLRLVGCQLSASSMEAVLETLYDYHLDSLEQLALSGNDLSGDVSSLLGKIVGSAPNLFELQLAKVGFDPVKFFEGLGREEFRTKASFFLKEIDLSMNCVRSAEWLKSLAQLVGMCGLNFERLVLNQALETPTEHNEQQAAASEEEAIIGLYHIISLRALRNGHLSMNGNPPEPVIQVLPELLAKGDTPLSLSVSDCALGDQPLCEILNALSSETCNTENVDLSYNLVYEPEVHKFRNKWAQASFERFLEDPVSSAAEMGEVTSQRNQVAFMVSDLFERQSCKINKFVLAGDPELSMVTPHQEVQRCLAFGMQLALPLTSLAHNKTITYLDITGNLIENHGATALAEALKVNRTITALRTDQNRITTDGFVELRKALYKNKKVVDWPVMQADLNSFLKLLQEEREKSTIDEAAAHDMVHKACSGAQVNLPLKEQNILQIREAKRILARVERDWLKVERYAAEIEDALIENRSRAVERKKEHELECENLRLDQRRNGFWWDARSMREKRDDARQETFEQSLMYKMWSRRARLKLKWQERCKVQEAVSYTHLTLPTKRIV
eukprot:TRINITY_DN4391_c0_g1_i2.p1 TRINITY_DN4391_c0_g1~~TRINITY_DN4391_c0_g1_i2.p1  ORF type:complete len:681 (+),score=207.71 TRINITY_DN4391_c0_g1_i2:972-3014(+)